MNTLSVIGRYAPSPTGPLHLGNLRTALLAWLQVRLAGGVFILRIEDLDASRVRDEYYGIIVEQLLALGIDWDIGPTDHSAIDRAGFESDPSAEAYTQSLRLHHYADAMERLRASQLAYPCFCSRKDIRQALSAPHSAASHIYPGTCRPNAGDLVKRAPDARGQRQPAWRMRVASDVVSFEDAVQGVYTQQLSTECGDFVVQRADQAYAYQLACAVDDGAMGITDVLRGADLLDSTPRQIAILCALGYDVPRYWHVPLLHDASGERMAKRDQSTQPALGTKQQAAKIVGEFAFTLGLTDTPRSISCKDLCNELTSESFLDRLRQHAGAHDCA